MNKIIYKFNYLTLTVVSQIDFKFIHFMKLEFNSDTHLNPRIFITLTINQDLKKFE